MPLFFLLLLTAPLLAADLTFPYGKFRLSLPPASDPFPGLGSGYSTINGGLKSAFWNPAVLGKLQLTETYFDAISPLEQYRASKSFTIAENGGTISFEGGGQPAGSFGTFFRTPEQIGSNLTTKEIAVESPFNYATTSPGVNFGAAMKINEIFSVGFTSGSPISADMDIAGAFPVTSKARLNLHGQKIGDNMEIANNGKLRYTESGTTYESSSEVWSGFLTQEALVPLTSLAEIRNQVAINSPYSATVAGKYDKFNFGFNFIPIDGTATVQNDLRVSCNQNANNIYLYAPNFNTNDPADILDWTIKETRYASADGFSRKTILLPTGEVIGTGKYRGYYAASTARLDLGMTYDPTDWVTFGLVLENIGRAAMNFKGNGIATYTSYRSINTAEVNNFEKLLEPGSSTTIDPISDTWTTSYEVGNSPLYLEPELNYPLPQRLRLGVAFKRPFLIALDWEQNQTPVTIRTEQNSLPQEITISNISLLRIGLETSVFNLPWRLRSGLALMSKPNVTGLTTEQQKGFNDAFQFGVLPAKIDLGTDLTAWGTDLGAAFGINALTMLNFFQHDTSDLNLSRVIYYTVYGGRDAWQLNYLVQVDPLATAAAYSAKTVPPGEDRKFEQSDLKFVHTVGVTYKF